MTCMLPTSILLNDDVCVQLLEVFDAIDELFPGQVYEDQGR